MSTYFNIIELSLITVLTATFLIQLFYYLVLYARIPVYRQRSVKSKETPAVSVVVIVDDDMEYVQNSLTLLLSQDYSNYEVVVVDNGSSIEVVNALDSLATKHYNLKLTRINPDPKFKYRRKFALTVGIKAASNPNVIFTETDSYPISSKWLSLMAKGFTASQVVIGYCGIESEKGLVNKIIRCSRLMLSVRYLSSGISGKPYRGTAQNIGYTKDLYFSSRGYTHLRINIGDDDLFIQKIADKSNTSIIINPNATVRQKHYGGLSSWMVERKYLSYAYRYYPLNVRFPIFIELFTRTLFFVSAAIIIALVVRVFWIVAISAIVVRFAAVLFTISRISKRLGEKGLLSTFFIHDLFSPLSEARIYISRRIKPSKGLWN